MTIRNPTRRQGAERLSAGCTLLSVLFVSVLAVSALAAPDFRAVGGLSTRVIGDAAIPHGSYDQSGTVQADGNLTFDETELSIARSYHLQANSLADVGGLHAHAFSQIIKNVSGTPGGFNYTAVASSAAYARYFDVVITGPAGPVSTSMNMSLDGSLTAGSFTPGVGSNSANASVQVGFIVNNINVGGGLQSLFTSNGSVPTLTTSGVLAAWGPLAGPVTSPSFLVQTGVPFTVEIQLSTFAQTTAYIEDSYILGANADFASTFSFATDRPVFNLPNGYSANSADAGIVNNTFIPEPGSMALMGAALLLLARRRRQAIPTSCQYQ